RQPRLQTPHLPNSNSNEQRGGFTQLAGYQFFGEVEIDGASGVLTVTLRDLDGVAQFRQPILPYGAAPHAAG
ncbi:hypothetical protein, partial [Xanthomonas floridensis]